MAIPNKLKIMGHNIRSAFQSTDTLLALFALFLWVSYFTQSFTGLDGVINTIQRVTSGNWANYNWFVGGVWYMSGASVLYWVAIGAVVVVVCRLICRIFQKPKEDSRLEAIENKLDKYHDEIKDMAESITKSIDNLANEIRLERKGRIGKSKQRRL